MSPPRDDAASRIGNWHAITAVSRVICWRRPLLWFSLSIGHYTTVFVRPLLKMRVVALGRWTLLPTWRNPKYMVVETNWSGALQSYIPDFAQIMQTQWRSIWGNTRDYPGPVPNTRMMKYVDTIDWGADHYWTDYDPRSTTQVIDASLELQPLFERFVAETRGLPPDLFAQRWRRFATYVQDLL